MAITLTSGATARSVEGVEGQSVGEVRNAFARIYNISENASAQVNGEVVDNDFALADGDALVFNPRLASKG